MLVWEGRQEDGETCNHQGVSQAEVEHAAALGGWRSLGMTMALTSWDTSWLKLSSGASGPSSLDTPDTTPPAAPAMPPSKLVSAGGGAAPAGLPVEFTSTNRKKGGSRGLPGVACGCIQRPATLMGMPVVRASAAAAAGPCARSCTRCPLVVLIPSRLRAGRGEGGRVQGGLGAACTAAAAQADIKC